MFKSMDVSRGLGSNNTDINNNNNNDTDDAADDDNLRGKLHSVGTIFMEVLCMKYIIVLKLKVLCSACYIVAKIIVVKMLFVFNQCKRHRVFRLKAHAVNSPNTGTAE